MCSISDQVFTCFSFNLFLKQSPTLLHSSISSNKEKPNRPTEEQGLCFFCLCPFLLSRFGTGLVRPPAPRPSPAPAPDVEFGSEDGKLTGSRKSRQRAGLSTSCYTGDWASCSFICRGICWIRKRKKAHQCPCRVRVQHKTGLSTGLHWSTLETVVRTCAYERA